MAGVVPQDRVERFHDWHLDAVRACPPDERALKRLSQRPELIALREAA